jgi:hypothetical protein
MIKPEWHFIKTMTNEARKTQELISVFIREAGIDEDSAKKCVIILGREMFKNGLSYDYLVNFWNGVINEAKK